MGRDEGRSGRWCSGRAEASSMRRPGQARVRAPRAAHPHPHLPTRLGVGAATKKPLNSGSSSGSGRGRGIPMLARRHGPPPAACHLCRRCAVDGRLGSRGTLSAAAVALHRLLTPLQMYPRCAETGWSAQEPGLECSGDCRRLQGAWTSQRVAVEDTTTEDTAAGSQELQGSASSRHSWPQPARARASYLQRLAVLHHRSFV